MSHRVSPHIHNNFADVVLDLRLKPTLWDSGRLRMRCWCTTALLPLLPRGAMGALRLRGKDASSAGRLLAAKLPLLAGDL